MVLNMIAKEPEQRKEAADYLEEYRGKMLEITKSGNIKTEY